MKRICKALPWGIFGLALLASVVLGNSALLYFSLSVFSIFLVRQKKYPSLLGLLLFIPLPFLRVEFHLVCALGVAIALGQIFGLRPIASWFQLGRPTAIEWISVAVISFVSALSLLLWAIWVDDLGAGAKIVRDLQGIPKVYLVFVGVPLFAIANSLVEELTYRGLLWWVWNQEKIESKELLFLSAFFYSIAHFSKGFPNGALGLAMTFVYGCALGWLRTRTQGVRASVIAHFAADLVIGYTLIALS